MTPSSETPSVQRWRVVVVDDNPEDLAEIRRLLLLGSHRRYDFGEASSGAAGIRAVLDAPGGPPDCLILDYSLPDFDAPEVLAALAGPDAIGVCPVVVITGDDGQDLGRAALRAGAQDFIGKGWMTPESLTRAVENAVERWAMCRELRASESRLRLALEASKTGIWTRDLVTDTVRLSPELHAIYGIPEGAFDGTMASFFLYVHPDDRARLEEEGRVAVASDSAYQIEFRMVRSDGAVIWVQSFGQATYDAKGVPLRTMGTIRDVTARHEAEEALRLALDEARRAVRTRDELVSLVSHDLKNPLNTLMLGMAVIDKQVAAPGRAALGMMKRQAARMSAMIDELVDAAQLYEGKPLALQREVVDLVDLVRATVQLWRESAPDHVFEVRAALELLQGAWDRRRIERVVDNLLSNAVKYSPAGGRVEIELETSDESGTRWASLRIRDQGIGIPESDRGRIFEWYARGENALQTTIPGTGIGLAGAREIVALHGGSLAVESEEGQGSTFTVRLPVVLPPTFPTSAES